MDDDAQKIIDAAVKQVNPAAPPADPAAADPSPVPMPTIEPAVTPVADPASTPAPAGQSPLGGTVPEPTPPVVEPVSASVTPTEPETSSTPSPVPPAPASEPLPDIPAAPPAEPPPPEPAPTPPGETPSGDTATVPPAASELMDSLIHPSVMPVPADVTPAEQSMAPQAPPPEKPKKKRGGKGILIATLLVLLLTLPLAVFFISNRQQQVADTRSRASLCCEGGECNDGWTFGRDENTPHASCDARAEQACRDRGGLKSGAGQCGGTGPTPPPGGGDQRCTDKNGNPGETCGDLNKCDTAGGCNPACNSRGTHGDQVCDVPNGYCKSGYSCRPTGTGYHLACRDNACVNVLCDPGVASCGNECSSNAGCQSSTNPTVTPPGGTGWVQCKAGVAVPPICGSCLVTSISRGSMSFSCELNCGGSASSCPGGSAGSYSIAGKWFHCKKAGEAACGVGTGSTDHDDEGNLGGSPWTIAGQTRPTFNGTFPTSGNGWSNCGRIQVDVKMNAETTDVAGKVISLGSDCASGGGGGGGGDTPTPTPTPAPQCTAIKIYDAQGADITTAVKDKTRKLKLGETITLGTPKGSANKAHFRIQGITDFTDNDTALSTATEYRLKIVIPTTITQTQGNFEVEIFVGGQWR